MNSSHSVSPTSPLTLFRRLKKKNGVLSVLATCTGLQFSVNGPAHREKKQENREEMEITGMPSTLQNRGSFPWSLYPERWACPWTFSYLCLSCNSAAQQLILASGWVGEKKEKKWDFSPTLWIDGVLFPGIVVRRRDLLEVSAACTHCTIPQYGFVCWSKPGVKGTKNQIGNITAGLSSDFDFLPPFACSYLHVRVLTAPIFVFCP